MPSERRRRPCAGDDPFLNHHPPGLLRGCHFCAIAVHEGQTVSIRGKKVLRCMGKPGTESLLAFRDLFRKFTEKAGEEQFLTCYWFAAHPGCVQADMETLRHFAARELALQPEQVQIFTPTPST